MNTTNEPDDPRRFSTRLAVILGLALVAGACAVATSPASLVAADQGGGGAAAMSGGEAQLTVHNRTANTLVARYSCVGDDFASSAINWTPILNGKKITATVAAGTCTVEMLAGNSDAGVTAQLKGADGTCAGAECSVTVQDADRARVAFTDGPGNGPKGPKSPAKGPKSPPKGPKSPSMGPNGGGNGHTDSNGVGHGQGRGQGHARD